MVVATEKSLKAGDKLLGFEIKSVTPIKALQVNAYEIEHLATGAKVLHLHNDDAENLFSVSFPTPPPDDTGIPHILEHSVLSGSEKYPVRDPFFEMLKMSPATFINAMTGYDCTYYPVSSKVKQDLFNLAQVYFDAVFHPLLKENTFKREGHHLSPIDAENPEKGLTVTGIVYNEMKGAFSDPEAVLSRSSVQALLPDTIYGKESGGDPQCIPDLTYQDFCNFHSTYYHPSNAYFIFYGNISTQEYLEFLAPKLNDFQAQEIPRNLERQTRWSKPQVKEESYPISANDTKDNKTFLVMNWLIGDSTDADEYISLVVLSKILLGNEAAPLKKAIIDAKLGQDILSQPGVNEVGWESTFDVGIKGSEAEKVEEFSNLVLSTLENISQNTIDSNLVKAAFEQVTYYYQEISSMYPLSLMMRSLQTWIYGGDPLSFLTMSDRLKDCYAKYEKNSNLFNELITEKLLNNTHRLTLILKPDHDWKTRTETALDNKIKGICQELTTEEVIKIAQDAITLEEEAGKGNSPEAIAKLPQLKLTDLPPKPESITTEVEKIGNDITLLRNQIFSNGVNYIHLNFNIQSLPSHLWQYLPSYTEALEKLGAAGMNYEEIAHRIAGNTGGINVGTEFITHAQNPDKIVTNLRITLKTLDHQVEKALNVLQDLLFDLDPSDSDRLKDIMIQTHAYYHSNLIYNGMTTAWLKADSALNAQGYLSELVNGLPQLEFTQKLAHQFDTVKDELTSNINTLRDFVSSQPLTISFTGSDDAYKLINKTLNNWKERRKDSTLSPLNLPFTPNYQLREGIAGPVQVAYCVKSYPAPHYSHGKAPSLTLAAHLIGLGYLFDEIRFKGNAYGGGCRYDSLGESLTFYSYRDPNISRTLEVFDNVANFIKEVDWRKEDIERAIITTTQKDSPVLRPAKATALALGRYLAGKTDTLREQYYEKMFTGTVKSVKETFLEVLEKGQDKFAVCVMSSREKLEKENQLIKDYSLTIKDI